MLNILIVDDEVFAVEGLLKSIAWADLDAEAYTANSAKEALDILSLGMDIVICDIKMPGKSGIELMREAKETAPSVVWIFLSAYAEFRYAQEALRLGAFDYLLKPCPPQKINEALRQARMHLLRVSEESSSASADPDQQVRIIEQFWRDILHRRIDSTKSGILEEAARRQIPLRSDDLLCPFFISYIKGDSTLDHIKRASLIKDVQETILSRELLAPVFEYQNGLIGMLLVQRYASFSPDDVFSPSDALIDISSKKYDLSLSVYIGYPVSCEEIPSMLHDLIRMSHNNLFEETEVRLLSQTELTAVPPTAPKNASTDFSDQTTLRQLFSEGKFMEAVHYELNSVRGKILSGQVTSDNLFLFVQEYLYAVYSFLESRNMNRQGFMIYAQSILARGSDIQRFPQLSSWFEDITTSLVNYLDLSTTPEEDACMEAVSYINEHLSDDLSRAIIADAIYLNPDYLGRIFKQRYGMFISDYINKIRIEKAHSLIETTSLTISNIATNVGFTHLSYFTKLFRDRYGMTPSEYRKTLISNQNG